MSSLRARKRPTPITRTSNAVFWATPTTISKGSGIEGRGELCTRGLKTSRSSGIATAAPASDAINRNQKTRQGNFLGGLVGALSVDPFGILGHHSITAKKRH